MKIAYSNELHDKSAERTIASAKAIVPIVYDIVRPQSVVDIGCGHGYWLREFDQMGSVEIRGVDGDYITPNSLVIPSAHFTATDLNTPLVVDRRYDLAMSIEVAEHLAPCSSKHFVSSLCKLSDTVLFSAAIPGQPGHCHINPNWPYYWADLFKDHGYTAIDFIRPLIWHMEDLLLCHRQNIILFVSDELAKTEKWSVMPRLNCLTLIDYDTIKHLLSRRESIKRVFRK